MAALTGNKIKDSYLGLLKTTDSGIFTSSLIRITDGGGNGSQLYLSNTAIRFHNAYTFPNADGTSGQVLSTDGSGTLYFTESSDNQTLEEVLTSGNTATLAILSTADGNTFGSTTFDAAVTGTTANFTTSVTSPDFIGDLNGSVRFAAKMIGSSVLKGQVVYISGLSGNTPEVQLAKADSTTTMTAVGIAADDANQNASFEVDTLGSARGIDLSDCIETGITLTEGDVLYVSATEAGHLTNVAPTGVANLIQNIGMAIRVNPTTNATIKVMGAGRANASPNLPTGILLGDTTNIATAITDGSVGQILSTDGSGSYSFIDNDEGTVTSIGISVPTGLTVTNSPITTSGTITIGGTLGVANGGTGATTLTGILVGNGTSAISVVSDGIVSGQVLSTNANGTYSFIDAAGGDVTKTGTITANQIAVWNDSTDELRSDETVTIGTDHSITLYQPNTNSNTTNYIIGGGSSMTTGELNTGFGSSVLTLNTTGVGNIAIGSDSLTTNVSGYNNVAVGVNTLKRTTASNNVAIGNSVLQFDTTGYENTAIGGLSQYNITTAYGNTSLGYNSLIFNSTGIQNTAIGWNSLKGVSTYSASNNTAIGYNSGSAITTGSYNVIIGSNTGSTIATSSSNIIISDGIGNIRQSFDFTGAATFNGNATFTKNQNADTFIKLYNPNVGTSTESTIYVTNSNLDADGLFLGTTGVNFPAGVGGFTPDGSHIGSGTGASGGLSIMTRAAADMRFYTSGHTNERMRISSGGNVGIGTSGTPSTGLELMGADNTRATLRITNTALSGGNQWNFTPQYNSASLVISNFTNPILTISSTGAATFSSSVTTNATVANSYLSFSSRYSTDSNYRLDIRQVVTSGLVKHAFNVVNGGTSYDNNLVLDRGNVGIGTNSPTRKLQVLSGASSDIASFGNDSGSFTFGQSSALTSLDLATSNAFRIRQGSVVPLTISSGGAVGIDNSSPDSFSGSGSVSSSLVIGQGTSGISPQLTLWQGNSAQATINFASSNTGTGQYEGRIRYTRDTGVMDFRVNSNAALSISSTGTTFFQAAASTWTCIKENTSANAAGLLVKLTGGSQGYYYGAFTGAAYEFYVDGAGAIHSTSTSITQITSDVNLKTEITDYTKGLSEVLLMKPRYYKYKSNLEELKVGFIAQEMEEALSGSMIDSSEINKTTGEKYKTYQLEWYPLLVKAIQEQQTIIEDLKARIETLEG